MSFIDDVKSRLVKRQDELPKLIQPERSHVQDLSDIAKLLELVQVYETALKFIRCPSLEAKMWPDPAYYPSNVADTALTAAAKIKGDQT